MILSSVYYYVLLAGLIHSSSAFFGSWFDVSGISCGRNMFKCKNGRCVSSAFQCDGQNDCLDNSDEENCHLFTLPPPANCSSDQWRCVDHLCIAKETVCNGEVDCLDGSDETLGCTLNMECDGFQCHDKHCVPEEWRCDGTPDCHDKSDELDCENHVKPEDCTQANKKFLCANALTCINLDKVCDNATDCPDKSDESNRCAIQNQCALDPKFQKCSHGCINLPKGSQCVCPHGYKAIDDTTCKDINECDTYGICDQKCRNTEGSYKCLCDNRYVLQSDNKTCKVVGGEGLLIYSSKTEIRGLFLTSQYLYPIAQNLRQVAGVNFDGQNIYWTDIFSEHESIVRSLEDGSERELLVTSGLGTPEDLAVDWITGNIYFTDSELHYIGVCSRDGIKCTVLHNENIDKPRAIVLNPIEGHMFWTEWGKTPQIARSRMDGTLYYSFVSTDIHWPNGLALDIPNDRLYWTDGKLRTLESIRLDGTDRRRVLEEIHMHPYSIAVFENKLYWSDWSTRSIQSCNKFTGKNRTTLVKDKKEFIYGLHVFHSSVKPKVDNVCRNSVCSDLCLISTPTVYTCACPQDSLLSDNRHSCQELEKKQVLIIAVKDILIKLEHQKLGKQDITALPSVAKNIAALTYNPSNNTLYVSDVDGIKKIVGINLATGHSTPLLSESIGYINSMDFDYVGNNIFWTDNDRKTVEVFSLNTLTRYVMLHDLGGEEPMSIALIPEEGVMFIAFKKEKSLHIDRMNMDGSSRTHVVESGLVGPIHLHYDYTLNRVFWADSGSGNIESTSAEGNDRHAFKALFNTPVSISSLKDDFFWTTHKSRRLYWSSKTGHNTLNKKITLDIPEDIGSMHLTALTSAKISQHPCARNNGNCSHICIPLNKTFKCVCPLGFVLKPDNSTCIKRTQCKPDEFHCTSSETCIPKSRRCDGKVDCLMDEDEVECGSKMNNCTAGFFRCSSGQCIPNHMVCDRHFDCSDRTDENNCSGSMRGCQENHFQCSDDSCISENLKCDGYKDCSDGSDETECSSSSCSAKQFRCVSSGQCIPKHWECDHEIDCSDMSDEHSGCALHQCKTHQFTCNNGMCIDAKLRCDNIDDCGDGSDEASCELPKKNEDCRSDEFQCISDTSICLPALAKCNGTSECPHHEDEQDCSDCQVNEFECKNKICITRMWLCDGTDDCGDASDESICNSTESNKTSFGPQAPCDTGFRCRSGSCIDYKLVCNGVDDCFDGSDENGSCKGSCTSRSNPCEQQCQATPSGPMCMCDEGFQLSGNGQSCLDVQECRQEPPICSQLCQEKLGGFACSCYDGFVLRSDKRTCKSTGEPMSLFYGVNNEIRHLSQSTNSLRIVHSEDTPRLSGMDYSSLDGYLYFSIEESGSILRINIFNGTKEYTRDLGRPQKIALDWITNNVYYVDGNNLHKTIQVCNFLDKFCAKISDVEVHSQVSSLTVDPINKYMFYSITNWWIFNNPQSTIYKANLDGKMIHEIVKSLPGYVTGLAADMRRKVLYFSDQHKETISRVNYDATEKEVIIRNLTKPNGLNLFEDHLYYLTNSGYMGKCQLYGSERVCTNFRLNAYATELFAIAQKTRQPGTANLCSGHKCDEICVPSELGPVCLCRSGRRIRENEKCSENDRPSMHDDRRPTFGVHGSSEDEGFSPLVALFIAIAILIVLVAFGIYYIIKKRHSAKFHVSMRFQNPIYGLESETTHNNVNKLNPGEHEYCNPMDLNKKGMHNSASDSALLLKP